MKKTKTSPRKKNPLASLPAQSLAAVIGGGDTRSGSRDDPNGSIIIIGRDGP